MIIISDVVSVTDISLPSFPKRFKDIILDDAEDITPPVNCEPITITEHPFASPITSFGIIISGDLTSIPLIVKLFPKDIVKPSFF